MVNLIYVFNNYYEQGKTIVFSLIFSLMFVILMVIIVVVIVNVIFFLYFSMNRKKLNCDFEIKKLLRNRKKNCVIFPHLFA